MLAEVSSLTNYHLNSFFGNSLEIVKHFLQACPSCFHRSKFDFILNGRLADNSRFRGGRISKAQYAVIFFLMRIYLIEKTRRRKRIITNYDFFFKAKN